MRLMERYASDEGAELSSLVELVSRLRPAWMRDAACKRAPPGVTWFPEPGDDFRDSIRICHGCPCRKECRAWAIERPDLRGIWGGLTARERESWRAQRRAPTSWRKST